MVISSAGEASREAAITTRPRRTRMQVFILNLVGNIHYDCSTKWTFCCKPCIVSLFYSLLHHKLSSINLFPDIPRHIQHEEIYFCTTTQCVVLRFVIWCSLRKQIYNLKSKALKSFLWEKNYHTTWKVFLRGWVKCTFCCLHSQFVAKII
jgi:hypothetical protein